jgi:hemolysin activation/secretion protein
MDCLFRTLGSGLLYTAILLWSGGIVFAQSLTQAVDRRGGSLNQNLNERRQRDTPLPSLPPAQPEVEVPAPTATPPKKGSPASGRLKIFVREIRLSGNTAFSDEELHTVTRPYENRTIDNHELQQLRYDLTRFYTDRGYVNSGAVIPDQSLKDGRLEFGIVEGRLTNIEVAGNEHFNERYLRRRIERGAETPLQLDRLQERLLLMLENPLIERLNSQLKPGVRPGEAILETRIKERSPYLLGLIFDNQIAPSIGGYEGTVHAGHRNLLGWSDQLSGQARFAGGLISYGFDYTVPLNRYDTTAHAWYAHHDASVVERPFNEIDIESTSESYGLTLSHPFYQHPGRTLAASVTLERRRSQTFLLGQPFSFSTGVPANGESSVTVLRFGQSWYGRSVDQVLALRSSFNIGLDAFDATINRSGPDGRFFSWLGQMQWARRFEQAQLIFRTDIQVSRDPLLPLEKFQIGGANSVRGYRENQLVRDWGFSSSLEYRHMLFPETLGEGKLFLAPFADVGGAWNIDQETPKPDVLVSVGLGVIWEPERRFHTHLYWGKPLVDVGNPNRDPQDYGLHFKVAGEFF